MHIALHILVLLKHLIITTQILNDLPNVGFQLRQMCFDGRAYGVAEFDEGRGFVSDERIELLDQLPVAVDVRGLHVSFERRNRGVGDLGQNAADERHAVHDAPARRLLVALLRLLQRQSIGMRALQPERSTELTPKSDRPRC